MIGTLGRPMPVRYRIGSSSEKWGSKDILHSGNLAVPRGLATSKQTSALPAFMNMA
jgi:hypothetical protein